MSSLTEDKKLFVIKMFKQHVQKKPSIIYILLFFVPIGYIVHFLSSNATLIFTTNFLAILPSAKLFKFANKKLSHYVSHSRYITHLHNRNNEVINSLIKILGGLLSVVFNNFVELVITITALVNGQIHIVQTAVLGSILFHILLVLGLCFLVGGTKVLRTIEGKKNKLNEIEFDSTAAQSNSSVLTVACISLILPASFSLFVNQSNISTDKSDIILSISYGTSIVLLVICVLYLYFKVL
ncbi:calcium/proton exchanger [Gigaspora margarita]|uniref:Calcium/proton exchanger n=1 Tax=Gigaspora margarita TaxID=4874 RepID=A0A8H4AYW6_GIGMA|nr:calcium/proton exchanger [Gigaspora margarita]